MKLTVRLEDRSLYRVARFVNSHARRLQRTLINRLTENRNFAVWELPYANPEATKEFIGALRNTFPPDIMPEVLLVAIQEKREELDKQYDKFRAVIGLKGGNANGST